MSSRRRAAWRAYLMLTQDVMPGMHAMPAGDRRMALRFAALNAHLRSHSREWGEQAHRLHVVSARAWEMLQAGDKAGAAVLLRVLAQWLFRLSRGSAAATGTHGSP